MKTKKILSCMLTMIICTSLSMSLPASAEDTDNASVPGTTIVFSDNSDSYQLLQLMSLQCSASFNNKVIINAYIKAKEEVAELGIINFEVQQSSDGTSGWHTVSYPADQLAYNVSTHIITDLPTIVTGGYYYRVIGTCHAKETGWFFPRTEEADVTSNTCWVPYS